MTKPQMRATNAATVPRPELSEALRLLQRSAWQEVIDLLEPLRVAAPDDAAVLHLMGVAAREAGDLPRAIALAAGSVAQGGEVAAYHVDLAHAQARAGHWNEAAEAYRRTLALAPSADQARLGLGMVRLAQGNPAAAVIELRRFVTLRPDHAEAQAALGLAWAERGRPAEAIEALQRAARLAPDNARVQLRCGAAYQRLGRVDVAIGHFRRALALDPDGTEAAARLAGLEAAVTSPQALAELYRLGMNLSRLGRYDEAAPCFARAVTLPAPVGPRFRMGLAQTRHLQGRTEEACALIVQALEDGADPADCYERLGVFHRAAGDFASSVASLQRAVALRPTHGHAQLRLTMMRRAEPDAARIDALRALCATEGLDPDSRATLHFALAAEIERCGDAEQTFAAYRCANGLRRAQYPFDARVFASDARAEALFHSDFFAARAARGSMSERPVFIVGMMRSGTTLVEQILASHPQVHGHGELTDIHQIAHEITHRSGQTTPYPDCLGRLDAASVRGLAASYLARLDREAPQAIRNIDKLPQNLEHLGLIALLFPSARIIYCVRDRLDTCLSNYFLDFGAQNAFTYDLHALGRYERHVQRLMALWQSVVPNRIMTVPYEALVSDPEHWSRALVAFLDLNWDDRCLTPHRTVRPIYTESLGQVRYPIHREAIGRAAPYARYLDDLNGQSLS